MLMLTASLLQHNLMQIHFSPGWHFVTQLQAAAASLGLVLVLVMLIVITANYCVAGVM